MLVLTRNIGDSIMIGDDVEVIVSSVKGNQVKLAIQCDKSIPVDRKEIYEQKKAEAELQNQSKEGK